MWLAKVVARVALGLVWFVEGLMPKILFVQASEVAMVGRLGIPWLTPEISLTTLGLAEILAGIWLLWGRGERFTFGGIIKNLGLLACGVVVWLLSPLVPSSNRGVGR